MKENIKTNSRVYIHTTATLDALCYRNFDVNEHCNQKTRFTSGLLRG